MRDRNTQRYVEPRGIRHREEQVDGVAQLRMRTRRQWFALAFLPFWLAAWTAGGIAAMTQLAQHFEAFLVFWLGMWAVGWIFAASTLAEQLFGAEIVRVVGGDLEVSNRVGPLSRTWRYRGGAIENVNCANPDSGMIWGRQSLKMPFFLRPRTGGVKFEYGAETIYLASGIDEPEGRVIADWITDRLPHRHLAQ